MVATDPKPAPGASRTEGAHGDRARRPGAGRGRAAAPVPARRLAGRPGAADRARPGRAAAGAARDRQDGTAAGTPHRADEQRAVAAVHHRATRVECQHGDALRSDPGPTIYPYDDPSPRARHSRPAGARSRSTTPAARRSAGRPRPDDAVRSRPRLRGARSGTHAARVRTAAQSLGAGGGPTRPPRSRTSRARPPARGRPAPATHRRSGCSASTSRKARTPRPHCPPSARCSASSRARRPAGAARPTRTCGSRSPSRRRRCSPRAGTTTRRSRGIGAPPASIRTRSCSSGSPARWPASGGRATRRGGRKLALRQVPGDRGDARIARAVPRAGTPSRRCGARGRPPAALRGAGARRLPIGQGAEHRRRRCRLSAVAGRHADPAVHRPLPATGSDTGGVTVTDTSYLPRFREAAALDGGRWCAEAALRRNLIVAGDPRAALGRHLGAVHAGRRPRRGLRAAATGARPGRDRVARARRPARGARGRRGGVGVTLDAARGRASEPVALGRRPPARRTRRARVGPRPRDRRRPRCCGSRRSSTCAAATTPPRATSASPRAGPAPRRARGA